MMDDPVGFGSLVFTLCCWGGQMGVLLLICSIPILVVFGILRASRKQGSSGYITEYSRDLSDDDETPEEWERRELAELERRAWLDEEWRKEFDKRREEEERKAQEELWEWREEQRRKEQEMWDQVWEEEQKKRDQEDW